MKELAANGSIPGEELLAIIEIEAVGAIAAKKEKMNRGIYSGAIGIFAKNEVNSSVVIRTLILRDAKFEFQVGGAITFDSNPEGELAEIFTKAKSIAGLLSISLED